MVRRKVLLLQGRGQDNSELLWNDALLSRSITDTAILNAFHSEMSELYSFDTGYHSPILHGMMSALKIHSLFYTYHSGYMKWSFMLW